jgi:uncharacterized protein
MSSAEQVREWVGGRLILPARIESMGDRRAEMSLWVELPELAVVGQVLEDPQDPQASFGQSLMRAMASPLFGEPRRPQRVRVADATLAAQLQSFSFLHVEVAPTPEFDKVVRSLGAFFGKASYFSDPSLTPQDIEKFFNGARLLWTARPWKLADDDALLHIEVPALGIDDGCLSIVGSLEEVRGFVFFPSYEDYERMSENAGHVPGEALAAYRALYFSFEAKENVPEGMRNEAVEHGWPLADEDAYPMLARVADGKPAPVFEHELELATAVMRALAAFAIRHPQALENYGDVELSESQFDENDLEVIVSVPHPLSDQAFKSQLPPRAMTLDSTPNPYGLPLESHKLEQLERSLGAFTLHRAIGLFCALASVPELPRPNLWLGEIMQHVKLADEAQARGVMELLMAAYNHVIGTVEQHRGLGGLIPEAADAEACREWARGYAASLGWIDPALLRGDVLDSTFAIRALAEMPKVLETLEAFRGDKSRETLLAEYRESLADDADFLLEAWAESRATPLNTPPDPTFRREMPKVGRNDPCPCGSGKKSKKCCGSL